MEKMVRVIVMYFFVSAKLVEAITTLPDDGLRHNCHQQSLVLE